MQNVHTFKGKLWNSLLCSCFCNPLWRCSCSFLTQKECPGWESQLLRALAVQRKSKLLQVRWSPLKPQCWEAAQWSVIIKSYFRKLQNVRWDLLSQANCADLNIRPRCLFIIMLKLAALNTMPQVFVACHCKGNVVMELLVVSVWILRTDRIVCTYFGIENFYFFPTFLEHQCTKTPP